MSERRGGRGEGWFAATICHESTVFGRLWVDRPATQRRIKGVESSGAVLWKVASEGFSLPLVASSGISNPGTQTPSRETMAWLEGHRRWHASSPHISPHAHKLTHTLTRGRQTSKPPHATNASCPPCPSAPRPPDGHPRNHPQEAPSSAKSRPVRP